MSKSSPTRDSFTNPIENRSWSLTRLRNERGAAYVGDATSSYVRRATRSAEADTEEARRGTAKTRERRGAKERKEWRRRGQSSRAGADERNSVRSKRFVATREGHGAREAEVGLRGEVRTNKAIKYIILRRTAGWSTRAFQSALPSQILPRPFRRGTRHAGLNTKLLLKRGSAYAFRREFLSRCFAARLFHLSFLSSPPLFFPSFHVRSFRSYPGARTPPFPAFADFLSLQTLGRRVRLAGGRVSVDAFRSAR